MRLEDIRRWLDLWNNKAALSPEFWDGAPVLDMLVESRANEAPIYVAGRGAYIYAIAVPSRLLRKDWLRDVIDSRGFMVPRHMGWGCVFNASQTWGELSYPFADTGSRILAKGTPLVIVREAPRASSYAEPNQILAHTLNLHLDARREHWETLNELGELVPRFRVLRDQGFIVTLERDALDEYLALSSSTLVRWFELTKWKGGHVARRFKGGGCIRA